MKKTKVKKERYTYKALLNEFYGLNMKYGINIPPKDLKQIQAMLRFAHVVGGEKTCKKFLEDYEKKIIERKENLKDVQ